MLAMAYELNKMRFPKIKGGNDSHNSIVATTYTIAFSYQAELQWRFALPISVLLLAGLAISLSKVNPRQGRYAQLFPAFLLYIIYADLIFVGRAWLQKGKIAPELGLWWVHGSDVSNCDSVTDSLYWF